MVFWGGRIGEGLCSSSELWINGRPRFEQPQHCSLESPWDAYLIWNLGIQLLVIPPLLLGLWLVMVSVAGLLVPKSK